MSAPPSPPSNLDPPFRGYIESTFDALLVFEAARRGMIPRVTRRLIERERGMVQSGAVFVFDEHESGIKRWTDGLVWSPSRILGNFLVYRETDKKSAKPSGSPTQTSPRDIASRPPSSAANQYEGASGNDSDPPPLGQGALARPRSTSDGGGNLDRQKERQLVGSLTNSYKFKEGGLVKKTMSVSVNGFAQHVVSYYAIEDVLAGKLRTPSSIPELSSLEISPEYLHKQNFRFPPQVEIGADGVPRYRGEPEEPSSPLSPSSNYSFQSFQQGPPSGGNEYYEVNPSYNTVPPHINRMSSPSSRTVPVPVPMPITLPSPAHSIHGSSHGGPGSAGSGYYESSSVNGIYAPPLVRQNSASSIASNTSAIRPGSSARRYQPYGPGPGSADNRGSSGSLHYPHRRTSGSDSQGSPYSPESSHIGFDVKPNVNQYYHHPPNAPGSFSSFYTDSAHPPPNIESPMTSPTYGPGYSSWQSMPAGPNGPSRILPRPEYAPTMPPGVGTNSSLHPPSSSESNSSDGQQHAISHPPPRDWPSHHAHTPGWEVGGTPSPGYPIPSLHHTHEDWRHGAGALA